MLSSTTTRGTLVLLAGAPPGASGRPALAQVGDAEQRLPGQRHVQLAETRVQHAGSLKGRRLRTPLPLATLKPHWGAAGPVEGQQLAALRVGAHHPLGT